MILEVIYLMMIRITHVDPSLLIGAFHWIQVINRLEIQFHYIFGQKPTKKYEAKSQGGRPLWEFSKLNMAERAHG